MSMAVNHLPVLTWNHLKLNNETLETGSVSGKVSNGLLSEPINLKLPQGVRRERVSSGQLSDYIESIGVQNPKEAVVAGKFPIYNRQRFATGMGKDVDDLLEELDADIITVEPGFSSEQAIKIQHSFADGKGGFSKLLIHAKAGTRSNFILHLFAMPRECDFLKECGWCLEQKELAQLRSGVETRPDKTAEGETKAAQTQQIPQAAGSSENTKADNVKPLPLVGMQTYLYLEERAEVHFHVVQMLEKKSVFFHDIGIYENKKSSLTMTKLDLGALTVYEGLNNLQSGDESFFDMDFGFLGLPDSFMDINYNDVFVGKKANGRMYFKEALLGNAQKTFRGTLDFRQYSTGSVGDEQEDVILLGEDIVNKTIPLILCEEEDVDGRHAATIGSLSDDMLFYMQTRGISKRKAEELMVRASLQHISSLVPSESIKKAVVNDICRVFE
ncbi:MAG: SufD family Fe-S cluster assembly protein [Lachnospiraceae bacterium]|nr:SufD family Fe-S cluster assembly protein [Lachnospiraceae bacterium]